MTIKEQWGDRIRVTVPAVLVGEGSVTTLALVVHELATNSLKYGALSKASGTLTVSCTADDSEVVIVWTEKGGSPVAVAKGQAGFGSKLVTRSITSQLGGSIQFDWPVEGWTGSAPPDGTGPAAAAPQASAREGAPA